VVVNQALGAGLPVIASAAVAAAGDLIGPGENGLIVETGSVDSLAEAMARLARNPARVAAWGEESRRRARAWTPAAGVTKWETVVREVLGPR
jgi:glycosyltransferase involved in cell wall biosynthesis